jgi:hypothetical protein
MTTAPSTASLITAISARPATTAGDCEAVLDYRKPLATALTLRARSLAACSSSPIFIFETSNCCTPRWVKIAHRSRVIFASRLTSGRNDPDSPLLRFRSRSAKMPRPPKCRASNPLKPGQQLRTGPAAGRRQQQAESVDPHRAVPAKGRNTLDVASRLVAKNTSANGRCVL